MAYKDKTVKIKKQNEYIDKTYDRINLTVKKGEKDLIKKAADHNGESVNSFINRAIADMLTYDKMDYSRLEFDDFPDEVKELMLKIDKQFVNLEQLIIGYHKFYRRLYNLLQKANTTGNIENYPKLVETLQEYESAIRNINQYNQYNYKGDYDTNENTLLLNEIETQINSNIDKE